MPKEKGSGLLARIIVVVVIISLCTALLGRIAPHISH